LKIRSLYGFKSSRLRKCGTNCVKNGKLTARCPSVKDPQTGSTWAVQSLPQWNANAHAEGVVQGKIASYVWGPQMNKF
jgi:hypothetical protein